MDSSTSSGAALNSTKQRLPSERLEKANARALAKRPFLAPDYEFTPVSVHDKDFQAIKRQYPYFGYVDVEVEGVQPFLMFSNNDDQVAQTYFWYGPDAFENLSLRIWRELARQSSHIFDIGAFTGVYSLTAAHANREANIYCFEPIKRIFGRLVVNLAVNTLGQRIKAYNLALSDTDGHVNMNLSQGYLKLDTGASLIQKRGKEIVLREQIETSRFDTFAERHGVAGMNLVKIDVEQAEKMVIEGMLDSLREHQPHLLVEVVSVDNLRYLSDILSPLGYHFALIDDDDQKVHIDDLDAHTMTCNVLFSTMDELRDFCLSFEPLAHSFDEDYASQRYLSKGQILTAKLNEANEQLKEANERNRRQAEKIRALQDVLNAMSSSRGWKIANGINVALTRLRRILRRG
ncbi:MAG TPA: FkbM family methyltransferase [Rubrobacter sp.]|nr:FkbM family methyltransferase [Rubrobacter sp.]